MKVNLDDHPLDIPCPNCGQKITQKIGWLKRNPEITCHGCEAVIRIDADDSFANTIKKVEDSLAELGRTLPKVIKLG